MKKFFTSLCLALVTILSMQATDVYILGTIQEWTPTDGSAKMTTEDGVIFTYTGDFTASSYFSFTTKLGEWGEIEAYRVGAPWNNYKIDKTNFGQEIACNEMGIDVGNAFLFTAAGNYTLTFNLEELTLVVKPNGDVEEEVITPDGLYIMGKVNGQEWKTNQGTKMTTTDNVVYTGTIEVADSSATFSFTQALSKAEENWSGIAQYRFGALYNNYQLDQELGQAVALGDMGTDYSFELPKGNYKLTVNMTDRTLVAEATEAPAQKYYIIGDQPFGGWNPSNPVELVQEGDVYTTTAVVGEAWFVFTGSKGSWDKVNGFRFGPLEANEDVTVGDLVSTQISTNGSASYHIDGANVEYKITFDPEALTFKFELAQAPTPGKKGDLNNDDVVDVADLNACINMILGLQTEIAAADVNGDNTVDVADMNIIINIILGLDKDEPTPTHETVTIGGVKWSTMNLGAKKVAGTIQDCWGDYYAWGETKPRYTGMTIVSTDSISFEGWDEAHAKGYYFADFPTFAEAVLDAEHDAATVNWGADWRTPTSDDFMALYAACGGQDEEIYITAGIPTGSAATTEKGIYWCADYDGVAGLLFCDGTNKLFFPASGDVCPAKLFVGGKGCMYWSATRKANNVQQAHALDSDNTYVGPAGNSNAFRLYYGLPIRPVMK